jgi:hypothetical protein
LVGATADGLFARGLVAAAACSLLRATDGGAPPDARRAALCDEAERQYSAAETALSPDPRGWLRVELRWAQAAHYNVVAHEAWKRGGATASQRGWEKTLVTCAQAQPDLPQGPVNDEFLAQQCIVAAGYLGRYADYFAWATWLQADDRRDTGKLRSRSVKAIYQGALPACGELTFEQRRKKWLPKTRDLPAFLFCYAAGLRALGCTVDAVQVATAQAWRDPSLPWSEIWSGGGSSCYLEVP